MKTFQYFVRACLLLAAATSLAQVPNRINYQGRLVNGPNLVNASTSMVFGLYEVAVGGTPVYVETQTVQVVDGLYAVSLGGASGQVTLREAAAHQPLFLEVKVGASALSPREQITAVPYALMSLGMPWVDVAGTNQQAEPNHGYLAHSSARVTVALPTNPVVGDIVRVAGGGAGGWKLAQNEGQSVMASHLNYDSVEADWVGRTNSGSHSWRNMGMSDDGVRMCAAADGSYIYTSSDRGLTWTNRASVRNWQGLACSGDGMTILAGVNGGYLYVSYDGGSSWTARLTGASRVWPNTAVSHDGRRMAATVWGESSGGYIYTSSDSGSNWTARMTDTTRKWNGLACSSNGMTLVAGNYSGYFYVSYDGGSTWTQRTSMGMGEWWGFACSADGMSMIGARNYTNNLILSTDGGITWDPLPNAGQRDWYDVAMSADGSRLLAVDSDSTGRVHRSTNGGSTWTAHSVTQYWYGVASSADGSSLMAGGNSGPIYVCVQSSTTLGPSGYLLGESGTAVELLYIGGGTWLPLSYSGKVSVF